MSRFLPPTAAITLDFVSLGAIVGALSGLLPPLAGLAAIIWYVVQIWESKTCQKWRKLRRRRHRMLRLALAAVDVQLAREESARPLDEPGAAP